MISVRTILPLVRTVGRNRVERSAVVLLRLVSIHMLSNCNAVACVRIVIGRTFLVTHGHRYAAAVAVINAAFM